MQFSDEDEEEWEDLDGDIIADTNFKNTNTFDNLDVVAKISMNNDEVVVSGTDKILEQTSKKKRRPVQEPLTDGEKFIAKFTHVIHVDMHIQIVFHRNMICNSPLLQSIILSCIPSKLLETIHGDFDDKNHFNNDTIRMIIEWFKYEYGFRIVYYETNSTNDSPKWKCELCTFINLGKASNCSMCGSAKISKNKSKELPRWICAVCTYANRCSRKRCKVCKSESQIALATKVNNSIISPSIIPTSDVVKRGDQRYNIRTLKYTVQELILSFNNHHGTPEEFNLLCVALYRSIGARCRYVYVVNPLPRMPRLSDIAMFCTPTYNKKLFRGDNVHQYIPGLVTTSKTSKQPKKRPRSRFSDFNRYDNSVVVDLSSSSITSDANMNNSNTVVNELNSQLLDTYTTACVVDKDDIPLNSWLEVYIDTCESTSATKTNRNGNDKETVNSFRWVHLDCIRYEQSKVSSSNSNNNTSTSNKRLKQKKWFDQPSVCHPIYRTYMNALNGVIASNGTRGKRMYPFSYIIGADECGLLKDVTRRYSTGSLWKHSLNARMSDIRPVCRNNGATRRNYSIGNSKKRKRSTHNNNNNNNNNNNIDNNNIKDVGDNVVGTRPSSVLSSNSKVYPDGWLTFMISLHIQQILSLLEIQNNSLELQKRQDEDIREEKELMLISGDNKVPNTLSGLKHHPLYTLERFCTQKQVIYPKLSVLGLFRGKERVYSTDCIRTVHSQRKWFQLGFLIKEDQIDHPAKKLKAKESKEEKSSDTNSNKDSVEDNHAVDVSNNTTWLYGDWQTYPYEPVPLNKDGSVHSSCISKYGNIELWTDQHLPRDAAHCQHTYALRAARAMEIPYTRALVGFEFKERNMLPNLSGVVIPQSQYELILEAAESMQREAETKKKLKQSNEIYLKWKSFVLKLKVADEVRQKFNL